MTEQIAQTSPATEAKEIKKRVKTPTILQMEAVECGAAALTIVMGYYNKRVPLEEVRSACGVSRDGSKATNVLKAARAYGFNAKGYRKEPAQLREMTLPLIIFWEFNHFLVVEGFSKKWVYLNDPAVGPRTVSHEEFDRSFTGVVLGIEPGPNFQPSGENRSVYKGLLQRLRGSEKALLFVFLAGLSLVIPGILIPVFSRIFVDEYLVKGLDSWLMPLLIGMVFTAALRAALTWLQQHYLLRLESKLSASMSAKFFWHVLRLPVEFYMQRFGGEIGNRVALNDRVALLLSRQLATTALSLVTILFYAALMFSYDFWLTIIGVLFAVLNVLALRYVSRRRRDINQRLLQTRGKLMGRALSGLQMIETLKSSGTESDFFTVWSGMQANLARSEQEFSVYSQVLAVVPTLLTALNTATILIVGGMRVLDGQLSLGMLVAFQSLMVSFTTPINDLVNLGSSVQEVEGSLVRLDDVLRYEADPQVTAQLNQPSNTAKSLPKLSGYLDLKQVDFGYSKLEKALISQFDLAMKPGSWVALVGSSGSGKSTVAKLVSGLFKTWNGEIQLDGKTRQQLDTGTLTSSLAVVDQDIFLFEGTIRENLTLWDSTVPEAQIVQAAKDACIHDEIAARPGGYESVVEEEGRNFSGGQRQRLEIARALVNNPSLLILDEATSALDPITEKTIMENLRRRGCTCLIIAHRLSTIRDCDEIIVLESGKVVQRGSHELMKNVSGPYANLIAAS